MPPASPPPPQPSTSRRALLIALLVGLAACDVEYHRGSSMVGAGGTTGATATAAAASDSSPLAGLTPPGIAAPTAVPGDTTTRRGPAIDSLSSLGGASAEAAGEVATTGTRTGPIDSTTVAATPAELAALDAALAIPVSGLRADQLVDSFDDTRGGTRRHDAIDILAPRGTPVVAATDGHVVRLFDSKAGGLMVYTTDATERFILMYGHLDRYADGLRDGLPIRRGQLLGYVGSTGNASPEVPHLHFAVARTADPRRWWGGTPVNPYPLMK